jgi:hypothetical protein
MFARMTSVLVVLFTALLAACTSPVRNDVTSFHDSALPRGATVRVVPLDSHKARTLEFEHYARLVNEHLRQAGYVPVDNDAEATLLAQVDYSISDGETVIRTRPGLYGGRYGPWQDPLWYGYYRPWYDPFYYHRPFRDTYPETYSYTQYHRELHLRIVDAHARGNAKPLYEGRVHSTGREGELASVLPYMVTAMFEDFPGQSGVTREVSISRS